MPYDPERQLDEMGEKLERLTEAVEDAGRSLATVVEKHERTLYGNGQLGITTRVYNLEQAEERGRWSSRMAIGAVVVVGLKLLADIGWAVLKH